MREKQMGIYHNLKRRELTVCMGGSKIPFLSPEREPTKSNRAKAKEAYGD